MPYRYSRTISLAHGQVGTTDSIDFPFPFSETIADLKTIANGGLVQNASGYDIVLASNSAGTSLLKWQVKSYDPTTGKVLFWIKAPTVSHTVDSVIYLCYGNTAVISDQSDTANTWSNGFVTVQGLDGNSNDALGVHNGTDTAITYNTGNGVVAQGAGFNGTSSQIALADAGTLLAPSVASYSVSVWAKAVSFANAYNSVESDETATTGHTLLVKSTGKLAVYISGHGGGASFLDYDGTGSTTLSTGTWYHLAFTYGQGTGAGGISPLIGYVNGAQDGTATGGTFYVADSASNPLLGNSFFANRFWNGALDEYRFANGVRSPDWILAEYNSQKSGATFYSIGSQVIAGGLLLHPGMDGLGTFSQLRGGVNA